MYNNNYVNKYKQNTVTTASREDIMVMLFDGVVKFVKKSKIALENKDYGELHINITKAQNILVEFIDTLDFSANFEIATNLRRLYEYNINLLTRANLKRDMDAMDEALGLLTGLRDTWRKAVEIAKKENFGLSDNTEAEDEDGDSFEMSDDDEDEYEEKDWEI